MPQVVGIINFHGITLWVVDSAGVEYVYAKPLSDLAGLDWRRTKRTIIEEENALLYGTTKLKHPVLAAEGGSRATPLAEGLYLRLDRARMYLARVNTRHMKAHGNVEAAEALLALQIEWAHVLHDYETQGVARKDGRLEARSREERNLSALIKTRRETADQQEKAAITRMIADKLKELGYPPEQAAGAQSEMEV